MDLLILRARSWQVLTPYRPATEESEQECDLLTTMTDLAKGQQYRASVSGLSKMLTECAEHGLDRLPAEWLHCVDKQRGIYEFSKGDLRLLYFQAKNGAIVICSHIFLKKGRKTPRAEADRAARLKESYEKAASAKQLRIKEKG